LGIASDDNSGGGSGSGVRMVAAAVARERRVRKMIQMGCLMMMSIWRSSGITSCWRKLGEWGVDSEVWGVGRV
jgi:hypothetical protein